MKKIIAAVVFSFSLLFLFQVDTFAVPSPAGDLRGKLSDQGEKNLTDGNDGTSASLFTPFTWTLDGPSIIEGWYYKSLDDKSVIQFLNEAGGVIASYDGQTAAKTTFNAVNINGVKQIRVANKPGWGSYGYEVDVKIAPDTTPPTVPSDLTATPQINAVKLDWSPSTDFSGVAGYNVFRNATKLNSSLVTGTTFTDTTAEPDVNYAYQVSAVDGSSAKNESAKTMVIYAAAMLPEIKPVLTVSALTDSSMRLNWESVASSYELYQDGALLTKPTTFMKYYDVTALAPSTSYTFTLIGIDKYGRRVSSDPLIVATKQPLPGKPKVSISDVTHKSFRVSWDAVNYANDYKLYLNDVEVATLTDRTYFFDGLDAEKVYSVKVVARGNEGDVETVVSTKTLKIPVPEILSASIRPSPGGGIDKRELSYEASSDVTEVEVYVNGQLVGTYPVSQNKIELDFANIAEKFAEVKILPTDDGAKPYVFNALTKTTGNEFVDLIVAFFLNAFQVLRKSFVLLAILSIPLIIVVSFFFWTRKKYQKLVPDRGGDNKPFTYVDNKESGTKLRKIRRGFSTDDTPDDKDFYGKSEKLRRYHADNPKLAYHSKKHFERTGFHVQEVRTVKIPVGFMGTKGVKLKKDYTYERNGVEYKQRYVKGQGRVYVPKDFDNRIKHVSNQFKAAKSFFTGSNKKTF